MNIREDILKNLQYVNTSIKETVQQNIASLVSTGKLTIAPKELEKLINIINISTDAGFDKSANHIATQIENIFKKNS